VHVDWCVYNAGGFSLLPGTAPDPDPDPSDIPHPSMDFSPSLLRRPSIALELFDRIAQTNTRETEDDVMMMEVASNNHSFVPIQSSSFIGLPNDDDSDPNVQ